MTWPAFEHGGHRVNHGGVGNWGLGIRVWGLGGWVSVYGFWILDLNSLITENAVWCCLDNRGRSDIKVLKPHGKGVFRVKIVKVKKESRGLCKCASSC